MTEQIEDEKHFLLECSVYQIAREQLYLDIAFITDGLFDMSKFKDKDLILDALIGRGIPMSEKRWDIITAVFKFLNRIVKIRKSFV